MCVRVWVSAGVSAGLSVSASMMDHVCTFLKRYLYNRLCVCPCWAGRARPGKSYLADALARIAGIEAVHVDFLDIEGREADGKLKIRDWDEKMQLFADAYNPEKHPQGVPHNG
jgi:hypothetical protein